MSLRIISATERLQEAQGKTTVALFGQSGAGKTTLVKSLPAEESICLDLEVGLKSVQDWTGDSLPIRRFADALDIACLIGGANPAAQPDEHFSDAHHAHLRAQYPDLAQRLDTKRIIFVDSITDLTRQAMAWAKAIDVAGSSAKWSRKFLSSGAKREAKPRGRRPRERFSRLRSGQVVAANSAHRPSCCSSARPPPRRSFVPSLNASSR